MKTFRSSKTLLLACFLAGGVACGTVVDAAAQENSSNDSPQSGNAADKGVHDIYGTVLSVNGSQFTIKTRGGHTILVDATTALETSRGVAPTEGNAAGVHGTFDANGVLHAEMVLRAKTSSVMWPADR